MPALFTLLAVVVAYSLLFLPDAIGTLRSDTLAALTYTSNWWQMIAHRSYIAEAGRPELLKHLWSLAIEEQYYLAWPFLLMLGLRKLGRRRMLATMLGTALMSTLLLALLANGGVDSAYYPTYTRLSGLLLGSAFAFSFAPYRIRGQPGRGARVALDIAGAAGLLALLGSFGLLHFFGINGFTFPTSSSDNLAVFRGGFLFVDVATLLVIAAAVHPVSDIGRALGWKPLQWIGLRSYSLYLWHYPIFCITRPGLDIHRVGLGFLSFRYEGWPVFVIRLALSFAAAELSFRLVETPIRKGAIGRYREIVREAAGKRRQRLDPARCRDRELAHPARADAGHRPRDRATASGERSGSQREHSRQRRQGRPARDPGTPEYDDHVDDRAHHADDEEGRRFVDVDDPHNEGARHRSRARHRRLGDGRRDGRASSPRSPAWRSTRSAAASSVRPSRLSVCTRRPACCHATSSCISARTVASPIRCSTR